MTDILRTARVLQAVYEKKGLRATAKAWREAGDRIEQLEMQVAKQHLRWKRLVHALTNKQEAPTEALTDRKTTT